MDKIELTMLPNKTSVWARHSSGTGAYLGVVIPTTSNTFVAACEDVRLGEYETFIDAVKAITSRCGYQNAIIPLSAY